MKDLYGMKIWDKEQPPVKIEGKEGGWDNVLMWVALILYFVSATTFIYSLIK